MSSKNRLLRSVPNIPTPTGVDTIGCSGRKSAFRVIPVHRCLLKWFRVLSFNFQVLNIEIWVYELKFEFQSFRVSNLRFEVWNFELELELLNLGFLVWGFNFGTWCFGFIFHDWGLKYCVSDLKSLVSNLISQL